MSTLTPSLSVGRCASTSSRVWPKPELTFLFSRLWIDFRILPVLALVYSFNLIDRINLGAAYAAGMGTDLVRAGNVFRYA